MLPYFKTLQEMHGSTSGLADPLRKHAKLDAKVDAQVRCYVLVCHKY